MAFVAPEGMGGVGWGGAARHDSELRCRLSAGAQVKRKPPCFEARDARSVQQRLEEQGTQDAALSVLQGWVSLYRSASALPADQKPSREELLEGPLRELLQALQVRCCWSARPREGARTVGQC